VRCFSYLRQQFACAHWGVKDIGSAGSPALDEAEMKQFPNAMKPFGRFCANVLKRLTCTGFPNDALGQARQGAKSGDDQCSIHSERILAE
jgi:hypothetical protein